MKRSQSWTDPGSPILTLRDTHFKDPARDIICWKFQCDKLFGVAMTSIQTFSEVRSLDVTWWPWSWMTWVWKFHICGKNVWLGVPKMAAAGAPRRHGCVQRWSKNDWMLWPSSSQGYNRVHRRPQACTGVRLKKTANVSILLEHFSTCASWMGLNAMKSNVKQCERFSHYNCL